MEPAIIIHGGCHGLVNAAQRTPREACMKEAVTACMKLLKTGESSLDAVELAVSMMEDDPSFNAGKGSKLRSDGSVEVDALIMEGCDLRAGSVAAVRGIKNPVKLARLVMEKTEHVQLCGEGARKFAVSMGVPLISDNELKTPLQTSCLERHFATVEAERGCDTVGAVAIDSSGCISCASSTGGIVGMMPGRVGDVPQIGSGSYADNHIGGVTVTGTGEDIARVVLARLVLFHMEQGHSIQLSLDKALAHMKERTGSSLAGAVVISKTGDIGKAFSTEQMSWASMKGDELCWGFSHDDEHAEVTGTI